MKKLIYVTLLGFLVLSTTQCAKDEIENTTTNTETTSLPSATVETRVNNNLSSLIFYRSSLTSDNYLIGTSVPRTHVIYNKKKIKDISFITSGQGLANIGGVLCKNYNIQINYIDNTKENLTAYSKSDEDNFVFIPSGVNLLTDNNTAKKITFISTNTSTYTYPNYYNFWRDTRTSYTIWKIYKDKQFTQQRYIEPTDKNSTQFQPPHAH
jgi:hypothetical protein